MSVAVYPGSFDPITNIGYDKTDVVLRQLIQQGANFIVAHASGGTSTSVHAASSGLSTRTAITAPTNRSTFCTIDTSPCDTRSCRESMSDVMRATRRATSFAGRAGSSVRIGGR